ncbi:MAG: hypothetical protein V3W41_08690 [Planctomycetota bacterium]
MYLRFTVAFVIFVVAGSAFAQPQQQQQSVEDRLQRLEQENRRILDAFESSEVRNASLIKEVQMLRLESEDLREGAESWRTSDLEQRVNALTSALDVTDWTPATKSGLPIRFYGFIRMDAYWNSARATDPIIPFGVLPEGVNGIGRNDSQFALDPRLTRFGFDVDAGEIAGAKVTAKLETDFANFPSGSTESRATPRIRLAYINFDFGELDLRIGQDWDVVSPLYPAVHSELLLWGVGNLGDRRAQVQLIWNTGDPKGFAFTAELSAGLTGAVDGADNDGIGGRSNIDGFDSGHPHGQLRLGGSFSSWVTAERAAIGFWGYVASLETDTRYDGNDRYTPFTVGVDIVLPLFDRVSLRGEAWFGQALSDLRGNILQDINTATGKEISGWGGFAEIHWQATDTLRLAVGGSIDDPDNGDLNFGVSGENRALNWTVYLSSKLDLGGGLTTGLDVIYWETQWLDSGIGNLLRANYWIQLNF